MFSLPTDPRSRGAELSRNRICTAEDGTYAFGRQNKSKPALYIIRFPDGRRRTFHAFNDQEAVEKANRILAEQGGDD